LPFLGIWLNKFTICLQKENSREQSISLTSKELEVYQFDKGELELLDIRLNQFKFIGARLSECKLAEFQTIFTGKPSNLSPINLSDGE